MMRMAAIFLVLVAGGCRKPAQGWTRLHTAADTGKVAEAEALIRSHLELVNVDDGDGHTPLHVATDRGNRDVVAVLLSGGAKIDAPDSCGWTALHTAAANGRTSTVELLIARGAGINARDKRNQKPLEQAVKWRHPETAELLRGRGGL